MPCDHTGPVELMEMAEQFLQNQSIPPEDWDGRVFRWSENVIGGMWAAVIMEVERRGSDWIVTRIDRLSETLPADETGLREIATESRAAERSS